MPQLPVFQAGPAALGRRADAGDFGGAEAAAAGQRAGVGDALGEIAAKIHEADQSARVSRAVGQASVQLDDLRRSLSQDNDFETHDDRFEKGKAQILKQAGQTIAPGRYQSELQDRLFEISARVRGSVLDTARAKQVDFAKANRAASLQDLSGAAARAQSPEEREAYRKQFAESTSSAVRAGLVGFDEAMSDLRSFDRTVAEAETRAAIRADPAAAFRELQNPASPLAKGFSEAEVEQWRERAIQEQEQQLAQSRAGIGFAQAQQDRTERKAADAAQRDADDALAKGDAQALNDVLVRAREVMTPEQRRWYLERIARGGGMGGETVHTVPGVYLDLSAKASRGEDVGPEADMAYRSGTLDQGDLERLKKVSTDRRFGDVQDFLRHATTQGMFDFDPIRQLKSAEVQRQFSAWAAKNPDATADQALEQGRTLLRAVAIKDGANLIRPTDTKDATGKVDVGLQVQQVLQRMQLGELDPIAGGAELKRLRDLDAAQSAGSAK